MSNKQKYKNTKKVIPWIITSLLIISLFNFLLINPVNADTAIINGENDDGYIIASGEDYTTIHNAATGTNIYSNNIIIGQSHFGGFVPRIGGGGEPIRDMYCIYRGFVYFDTSSIPAGATISSAVLKIKTSSDSSQTDFDIVIRNGQPTYPHQPLTLSDYALSHYGSTNGGSASTSACLVGQYLDINLNANGLNMITKGGTTKLALLSSRDINSNIPAQFVREMVYFYTAESAGNEPQLEVTYTVSSPPNTPSRPSGPTTLMVGQPGIFSSSTTDPDGDNIFYNFRWDDGTYSGWIGPYAPGATATASKSWSTAGTYNVDVRARDVGGLYSSYSPDLIVIVNDIPTKPPIANDDSANTDEDNAVIINVLANDIAVDNPIDPTTVAANLASHGTINVNPTTGAITYTPSLNYHGSDSFTYTVDDTLGYTSNQATVSITINDINDAPTANDDTAVTDEEVPVNINILTNDNDIDGTIDPTTVIITTDASNGGTSINPTTGVVTYTPNTGFIGINTFEYTVDDNDATTSNIATVTITVNNIPDPPTANNDNANTDEDNAVIINVLANDIPGDAPIDPTTVYITGGPPPHGTKSVDPITGLITYTPDANYHGSDGFMYTVDDIAGETSNIGTVSITINDINDLPTANDDSAGTPQDVPVDIDILNNDNDIDGSIDPTTVIITTQPSNGDITNINPANGVVTYTPNTGFFGADTFKYTVEDDDAATSNIATVTISVGDLIPPVLVDNTAGTATTGDDFIFTATATDNIGISSVTLSYWYSSTPTIVTDVSMSPTGVPDKYDATITVEHTTDNLCYSITALDTTSNSDSTGNQILGAVVDNDKPEIIDNTVGPAYIGDTIFFNATVTDNIDTSLNVQVDYRYGSGVSTNLALSQITGNEYSTSIIVADTTEVLYYSISALDSAINLNQTGPLDLGNVLDNHPPTIHSNTVSPGDGTGEHATSVTWGVNISDQDGDKLNWYIICSNGQAEQEVDDSNYNWKNLTLSLAEGTTYTVWMYVNDGTNWTNQSFTFTTKSSGGNEGGGGGGGGGNLLPTAKITGPASGYTDTDITFDGSQSSDPDNAIIGYKWDFNNDGTYDTGYSSSATITHKFTSPGEYTIKLCVQDATGGIDTDRMTIEILESTEQKYPPEADAAGPYNGLADEIIELDGSGSSDSNGNIVNYTWDLGDGTTLYGEKIQHIYTESGKYLVKLTVTDNDGLTDDDTAEVNIQKDTDGDGWYDDVEESYETNPEDPEDHPLDTDNDGIADEKSPDDLYPGDPDDDNDGIEDGIEELIIGSDPKNSEDVRLRDDGLFDILNSDGKIIGIYNPETKVYDKIGSQKEKNDDSLFSSFSIMIILAVISTIIVFAVVILYNKQPEPIVNNNTIIQNPPANKSSLNEEDIDLILEDAQTENEPATVKHKELSFEKEPIFDKPKEPVKQASQAKATAHSSLYTKEIPKEKPKTVNNTSKPEAKTLRPDHKKIMDHRTTCNDKYKSKSPKKTDKKTLPKRY